MSELVETTEAVYDPVNDFEYGQRLLREKLESKSVLSNGEIAMVRVLTKNALDVQRLKVDDQNAKNNKELLEVATKIMAGNIGKREPIRPELSPAGRKTSLSLDDVGEINIVEGELETAPEEMTYQSFTSAQKAKLAQKAKEENK